VKVYLDVFLTVIGMGWSLYETQMYSHCCCRLLELQGCTSTWCLLMQTATQLQTVRAYQQVNLIKQQCCGFKNSLPVKSNMVSLVIFFFGLNSVMLTMFYKIQQWVFIVKIHYKTEHLKKGYLELHSQMLTAVSSHKACQWFQFMTKGDKPWGTCEVKKTCKTFIHVWVLVIAHH
jgi:hypothetical protein